MQGRGFNRPASPWLRWPVSLLAVAALAIAAYLSWTALSAGQVAGCEADGVWDCSSVLQSRWSKWFGVPVSIPAASVYATLLAALCFIGPKAPARLRRIAWSIVTVLAVTAGMAAIWFISLQLFVLHGLCIYCMVVHSIGITIMAAVLISRSLPARTTLGLSGVGVFGIVLLIAGQVLVQPPATHEIEVYADHGRDDVSEPPDVFEMNAIDDSQVMDLGLPEDIEQSRESDVAPDQPAQTAEAPKNGSASSASPSEAPPSLDEIREGLNRMSDRRTNHSPQPSMSPTPNAELQGQENEPADGGAEGEADETEEPSSETPKRPSRKITILNGTVRLDIYGRPIVGSPEAKHVLVELFDYTCPHCRTMYQHLKVAHQRYGDQMAVLTLPMPLNAQCNSTIRSTSYTHRNACELARCALAVWRRKPKAFAAYHDWLFQPYNGRSPAEARTQAAKLIGEERLREELNNPVLQIYIDQHAGLYRRAGKGRIPKLMSPEFTITGQTASADALCRDLERQLGLKRIDR